jgi:ligand-binding sensor domain-containing protein
MKNEFVFGSILLNVNIKSLLPVSLSLIILLAAVIKPQSINLLNDNIKFERLTTRQGLPSDFVQDVIIDSRGFMWISTFDGLVRYDGKEFKVFRNNPIDTTSISANCNR